MHVTAGHRPGAHRGATDSSAAHGMSAVQGAAKRAPEPLLREALGLTLRAFRADKGITLRELAGIAHVSPGYLSELERGRKEVSSEMLAAVCAGLGTTVADVLLEAAGNMVMPSVDAELASTVPAAREA
ncbi:helix-turn-helix transcriptional regulator [Corynebacterium lizhenjunii]|uniref:Helix-turn-helix transcriptional regulator n=2 Tax=Corynebacterium lizhenjunii TaxID=2709394 RepID=A0A7T0KGF3_9CORY|nr:helix-turn-helix transcriptional regulator [Corynebacterium lizhenjunii]